jgi:hypothetical protein
MNTLQINIKVATKDSVTKGDAHFLQLVFGKTYFEELFKNSGIDAEIIFVDTKVEKTEGHPDLNRIKQVQEMMPAFTAEIDMNERMKVIADPTVPNSEFQVRLDGETKVKVINCEVQLDEQVNR